MKYTKKAYLTLTPPPPPPQEGSGKGDGGVDMTQLLKTMAIRQEEEKTPYTNQLLRLKDELQEIMMNPTFSPSVKLKLLNDRSSIYRDMLRRSKRMDSNNIVETAPVTASPSMTVTSATASNTSTPKRPVPLPRRRLPKTTPKSNQDLVEAATPRGRSWTPQQREALEKDLVHSKRKMVEALKQQMKSMQDSGLGTSPTANRTRSRTRRYQQQEGQGKRLSPYGDWKKVRFTRQ